MLRLIKFVKFDLGVIILKWNLGDIMCDSMDRIQMAQV